MRNKTKAISFSRVSKAFLLPGGKRLQAVKDVSLTVKPGEAVAVVGESGCGKSTLARLGAGLEMPDDGSILFQGEDISGLRGVSLKAYRRQVQMVFQDSANVISPRMKVGAFLMEPWKQYEKMSRKEAEQMAFYSLSRVGLKEEYFGKYPHELSGGELQRVCVARAIALHPALMICDEATSALDVSVQKQVVGLLKEHQAETGCSLLFICHDLALAEEMGNRVAVMYLGRIVELVPGGSLKKTAAHPYTRALLEASFSVNDGPDTPIRTLPGESPSPINLPEGCAFHTRCPHAGERCGREVPELREIEAGHFVACHRV